VLTFIFLGHGSRRRINEVMLLISIFSEVVSEPDFSNMGLSGFLSILSFILWENDNKCRFFSLIYSYNRRLSA
jgi:hypothetical protein